MRLIDADALNLAFRKACDYKRQTPRGCLNRFDLEDILTAAPTVCCETCEHFEERADDAEARIADRLAEAESEIARLARRVAELEARSEP